MKKITIALLLLPIFTIAQERLIGIKQGETYVYRWNIKKVIQSTFTEDIGSDAVVDTVYTMSDSTLQVSFTYENVKYSNIVVIQTIRDSVYTNLRATGCLNSCYKEGACSHCKKNANCDCYCELPVGSCSNKNLAIFVDLPLSKWVNLRIRTLDNPE